MATRPGPAPRRIGEFVFEPSTGEVRPADAPPGTGGVRLPPQPAKLLEILIEKNGELATREEIRAQLWPDVHVDFDQSLHFCVRQVRSAFGESASEPTYVETLPRRGYRLMRPVEPQSAERAADRARDRAASADGREAAPVPSPLRWTEGRRPVVLAGLLVLLAAAVAAGLGPARACRPPGSPEPIRLAIMPFELAAQGGEADDLARLSEWLVAELSGRGGDRLEVIGPRSTAAYSAYPFPHMERLAEDLAADFVLNARLFDREGESQLIVELIRLDDGAHPWVEFFTDTRSWDGIAREVRDGVAASLRLPPAPEPAPEPIDRTESTDEE